MTNVSIPTVETDRLILRAPSGDDFEAMVPFYASEISRFYGGPCDRDDAWRRFAMYPGHWLLRGYGPWVVEAKDGGPGRTPVTVGLCGPRYPESWIEPEITWALVPGHHGRGYATEAARAALDNVYGVLGWTTAISVIATANDASVRVAERLGATPERELDYRYGPARLYRHQPPGAAGVAASAEP